MSSPYRFHSRFDLPAAPQSVFAVLHDIEAWPSWWPQIRSVTPIDDVSGYVSIRSVLPITLNLKLVALVDDEPTGTLKASLDGDLTGWSQFVVEPCGAGSALIYDQVATVSKPGPVRLAAHARPLLKLNHRLMMRAGMRGLLARALANHPH